MSKTKARIEEIPDLGLPPELVETLLVEAERLEALCRQEDDAARAERVAQAAETLARQATLDEICRLQFRLINNELPEIQEYNATRLRSEGIIYGKRQLALLYRQWPEVFGLPGPGHSTNSDHVSQLPVVVQNVMRKTGEQLRPHTPPPRIELINYLS